MIVIPTPGLPAPQAMPPSTAAPVCDACHRPHPDLTITGVHGRRCPDCPPAYDRAYARACVASGRPGDAWAHLRTAICCYPVTRRAA